MAQVITNLIPRDNILINSNFDFWQRATSLNLADVAKNYVADRWYTFVQGAAPTPDNDIAQTGDVPIGSEFSLRSRRNPGNTNVSNVFVGQSLETKDTTPLQGKDLFLSFQAKKGANYSPTSDLLAVEVRGGEGVDEDPGSAFTNESVLLSQSVTLTGSYQVFNLASFNVPTTVTQIKVQFIATPTGTAGADDFFLLSQIMLNKGKAKSEYSIAGETIEEELALCERYYEKSYDVTVDPGTSSFPGSVSLRSPGNSLFLNARYKTRKRAIPTPESFSPTGSIDGFARNNSSATDVATVVSGVGETGFLISVGVSNMDSVSVHWTADSEL